MKWWIITAALVSVNILVLWSFGPILTTDHSPTPPYAPSLRPPIPPIPPLPLPFKEDTIIPRLGSGVYHKPTLESLPRTSFVQARIPEGIPLCSEVNADRLFEGPLPVTEANLTEEFVIATAGENVLPGGFHAPVGCERAYTVAIIVPYRDRESQVLPFLNHMHRLLKKQHLLYQVFFVEQADDELFNRGMLLNIGFTVAKALGEFNCLIFSDVDLLPLSEQLRYDCLHSPKHLSAYMDSLHFVYMESPGAWKYFRDDFFGGVSAVSSDHFEKANGFPNLYYGWGGEDDDLFRRLKARRLKAHRFIKKEYYFTGRRNVTHPERMTDIAKFHALYHIPHNKTTTNHERNKLLKKAVKMMVKDGLTTLAGRYDILSIAVKDLCTWIKVDLIEAERALKEIGMTPAPR